MQIVEVADVIPLDHVHTHAHARTHEHTHIYTTTGDACTQHQYVI